LFPDKVLEIYLLKCITGQGGGGGKTMYTHVSKCKNNKINGEKKKYKEKNVLPAASPFYILMYFNINE
jgi:hypothetical protein